MTLNRTLALPLRSNHSTNELSQTVQYIVRHEIEKFIMKVKIDVLILVYGTRAVWKDSGSDWSRSDRTGGSYSDAIVRNDSKLITYKMGIVNVLINVAKQY